MKRVAGDAPRYVVIPPLALGIPLMAGLLLSLRWPLRTGLPAGWRLGLAAALALLFFAINGVAYAMMLRARTGILPGQPAARVLARGPFALSRNPLYVGLTMAYASFALYRDSAWALLLLPVALLALHFGAVLPEERYMETKFGEEYLQYKRRVRRWL